MKISNVEDNQNFEGKVVSKNRLSKQNNYLFNTYKPTLQKMVDKLPFDLLVKQSNNKKIITFSTNVKGANVYQVYKRKQNFLETAENAISDAKEKSEEYKIMVKRNEILSYVKMYMLYVINGKFKEAREVAKQIAELGIKNFDIYKSITNYKLIGIPPELNKKLLLNSIQYKIYNAFSKKTPEEKQLIKMNKEYIKKMKAQGKDIKPVVIDISKSHSY